MPGDAATSAARVAPRTGTLAANQAADAIRILERVVERDWVVARGGRGARRGPAAGDDDHQT
jgi:hypothetical protein